MPGADQDERRELLKRVMELLPQQELRRTGSGMRLPGLLQAPALLQALRGQPRRRPVPPSRVLLPRVPRALEPSGARAPEP